MKISRVLYQVYKITNIQNNMIYIGVHQCTHEGKCKYLGSGKNIMNAVKFFGKHNFKKEILLECSSADEMFLKEKELVNESFIKREDTYNVSLGGRGLNFTGCNHTEESKKRIGEARKGTKRDENVCNKLKGKNNPMHGKSVYDVWVEKYGEEEAIRLENNRVTKRKVTMKNKTYNYDHAKTPRILRLVKKYGLREGINREKACRKKLSNSLIGKKLSPEHTQKLSKAMLGKKHSIETINKISKSNLGKKKSESHKQNIKLNHWRKKLASV
jgi:hypothetical protein